MRTQPGACLMALPDQRPFGLPSHVARLNGAGHTGRPRQLLLRRLRAPTPGALPPASLQSCPGCPQMGIPAHLSPNDPHDRHFQVVPSGKPPAGCLQNEPHINLQRSVGLLPPRRVGNLQGETGNPSRGRPGPLPTRITELKSKRCVTSYAPYEWTPRPFVPWRSN